MIYVENHTINLFIQRFGDFCAVWTGYIAVPIGKILYRKL